MTRLQLLFPLLAAALLALSSAACDELENIDNFEATVSGQTVVAAATPLDLLLGSFDLTEDFSKIDITQAQGFNNDKYSRDDVDSVHLARMTMTVIDPPQDQDLAFLGTVVFFVETPDLPPKEIARQENFPTGARTVDFDVTRDDLADYLLAPEGTITVDVLDSNKPQNRTTIQIDAVFDIDVNVI